MIRTFLQLIFAAANALGLNMAFSLTTNAGAAEPLVPVDSAWLVQPVLLEIVDEERSATSSPHDRVELERLLAYFQPGDQLWTWHRVLYDRVLHNAAGEVVDHVGEAVWGIALVRDGNVIGGALTGWNSWGGTRPA